MIMQCTQRWVRWVVIPVFLLVGHIFGQETTTWLTIFNNDLAEIRQQFTATISTRHSEIHWQPVSKEIIMSSVQLRSLSEPEKLQIIEQQFYYNPLTPGKLLDSLYQQPVTLIFENGQTVTGKLLNVNNNAYIIKTETGVRIIPSSNRVSIETEREPRGFSAFPTLVWKVKGLTQTQQKFEVDYLTKGLDWGADYLAIIQPDEKNIEFSGVITVNNRLDLAFVNARVKFIVGEPHQVKWRQRETVRVKHSMATAPPSERSQPVFEYHQYQLLNTITIKPRQKHQFPFLTWQKFPIKRHYIFDARRDGRHPWLEIHFQNQGVRGGNPLPAGVVRVYLQQKDGRIFVGEDFIPHTPRKETIKLLVGRVFDIIGERREVERRQVSSKTWDRTVEIELRNRKPHQSVLVEVRETLSGQWKILSSNFPVKVYDTRTALFEVRIPADSVVTLKYRVREKW